MAFFKDLFLKPTEVKSDQPIKEKAAAQEQKRVVGFPLAMAQAGEPQCVTAVKGKDDTRRFLGSLGFAEGAEVTLISEMNGNVIVNVKGTRVAVSKVMAMRVYVA